MIQLIVGVKGTGKTKTLVDEVHAAAKNSKGVVVCIEYGRNLTYYIRSAVRLIDAKDYEIKDATALYGFVCGILSGNYDVTEVFVDSALKICGDNLDEFEDFIYKLEGITEKIGVDCVITASLPIESLPEGLKKYLN